MEREALPLIDMRVLPVEYYEDFNKYLYYAFQINFKLRRYKEAHQNLQIAFDQRSVRGRKKFVTNLLKYFILLKVFLGIKDMDLKKWSKLTKKYLLYNQDHDIQKIFRDKKLNTKEQQEYMSTRALG